MLAGVLNRSALETLLSIVLGVALAWGITRVITRVIIGLSDRARRRKRSAED